MIGSLIGREKRRQTIFGQSVSGLQGAYGRMTRSNSSNSAPVPLAISGLLWHLLEYGLKKERVACESGSRFRQIRVQFQFTRILLSLRFLEKENPHTVISNRGWSVQGHVRTSTNCANARFELLSFLNSYLPYSWCAPYETKVQ